MDLPTQSLSHSKDVVIMEPPTSHSLSNSREPGTKPPSITEWNELSCEELRLRLLPDYGIYDHCVPGINPKYVFNTSGSPVSPCVSDGYISEHNTAEIPTNRTDGLSSTEAKGRTSLKVCLEDTKTISDGAFENCFQLVEAGSAAAYKVSREGWSPTDQRIEMRDTTMKYLLLQPTGVDSRADTVQGFLSFRIMAVFGREVIYIYKFHVREGLRGKGAGTWLMELVEKVAERVGVPWLMLTVWESNDKGIRLYDRLGYGRDVNTPQFDVVGGWPSPLRVKVERFMMSKRLA